MNTPIDIVYTWVNGNDSTWQAKRESTYASHFNASFIEVFANVHGRFRDNGELKYSLRSIEKYFKEVRKIWILTDGQIPPFLKSHPKVEVIFHTQCIPSQYLPTFSSKNIATHLVNIPGIAENFVYFNDDVFLGPDFQVTDFFAPKPVYYFDDVDTGFAPGFSDIIEKKFPEFHIPHMYATHSPKVVNVATYKIFEKIFSENIESVRKEAFRDVRNPSILCDLYTPWMIASGNGVLGNKKIRYIESGESEAPQKYDALIRDFEHTAFFCINDTGDNLDPTHPSLQKIGNVLETLFPEPSSFEN